MNVAQVVRARMLQSWQYYQDELVRVISPLTDAQLGLRLAANQRTAGELAEHIVRARALWLPRAFGAGDATLAALANWDEPEDPPRSAPDITAGLALTWEWILSAIGPSAADDPAANVTGAELEKLQIIWGLQEHDVHHGGELAYTLGAHGLAVPDV